MSMNITAGANATKPSLETMAGLYRAVAQRQWEADFGMGRIREELVRHGYTEEQVREAAGIKPAKS